MKVNESLLQKISYIIIDYAKRKEVIEYNQISNEIGGIISPIKLNEPLGEISIRCIRLGFPPLSAIVVNQGTRLPGNGFFTWVAAQMGYPDLPPPQWETFFEEQKERIFNCKDWEDFLSEGFSVLMSPEKTPNKINIINVLETRDYLKGKNTQYYILTVKDFKDIQKTGPFRYRVFVSKNDKLIREGKVEDSQKKELLTRAKITGIRLLLEYSSSVLSSEVTMVHYKPDRLDSSLWVKESVGSLNVLFREEHIQFLKSIAEKDIESEAAQEDYFYSDGKATEYHGTRYERNPLNKARAIRIHGSTCKVCEFNFKKVYGELGKDYIEVHHIQPLHTLQKEIKINPLTDLVPVCSNCHRMIHRKMDDVLTIDELKGILLENLTLTE